MENDLLEILRDVREWNESDLANLEEITPNEEMLLARRGALDEAISALPPLIAAAPDLLEACKALHDLIDKHSGQPPISKLVTLCRNLDAAIAKAEGRQP